MSNIYSSFSYDFVILINKYKEENMNFRLHQNYKKKTNLYEYLHAVFTRLFSFIFPVRKISLLHFFHKVDMYGLSLEPFNWILYLMQFKYYFWTAHYSWVEASHSEKWGLPNRSLKDFQNLFYLIACIPNPCPVNIKEVVIYPDFDNSACSR